MLTRPVYRSLSTESELPASTRPSLLHRLPLNSSRLRSIIGGAIIVAVCLVVVVLLVAFAHRIGSHKERTKRLYNPTPLVNTTCGYVQGHVEDAVHVFKGIPYAVPPVGARRWAAPQQLHQQTPDHCWRGAFQAYKYGAKCRQISPVTGLQEGSEDCLFVNVWTPAAAASGGGGDGLDVLVYIHGGELMYGSGNTRGKLPTPAFVNEGNMVVVSFNYRLNIFGYLTLDVLATSDGRGATGRQTAANYGLLDQMLALRWVQDNIAAFGGDPKRVTLLGHGSGATSILALLAAPQSAGLYSRAWLMSSGQLSTETLDEVQHRNNKILNATRCTGGSAFNRRDCLLSIRADLLLDLCRPILMESWFSSHSTSLPDRDHTSSPHTLLVVDGSTLPRSLEKAYQSGSFQDVPLVIGHTAQETDINLQPASSLMWSWQTYHNYLSDADLVPHDLAQITNLYPEQHSPAYQLTSISSDIRVVCPGDKLASLAASYQREPVYRYVVTSAPSQPISYTDRTNSARSYATQAPLTNSQHRNAAGAATPPANYARGHTRHMPTAKTSSNPEYSNDVGTLQTAGGYGTAETEENTLHYAYHGWDLMALFGTINDYIDKLSNSDIMFRNTMRSLVFEFVKQGALRDWLLYPINTVVIGNEVQHNTGYHNQQCRFWFSNNVCSDKSWWIN